MPDSIERLIRQLSSRAKDHYIDSLALTDCEKITLQRVWEFAQLCSHHREDQKLRAHRIRHLRNRSSLNPAQELWDLDHAVLSHISSPLRLSAFEWIGFIPAFSGETGYQFESLKVVDQGARTHVNTDAKEFFRELLLSNCDAFVMAHNHPSGTLQASTDDLILSNQVENLAEYFGLRFLGHAIVYGSEHEWIPTREQSVSEKKSSKNRTDRPHLPLPH